MISLVIAYVVLFTLAGAAGLALGWVLRRLAAREQIAFMESDTAEFRSIGREADGAP